MYRRIMNDLFYVNQRFDDYGFLVKLVAEPLFAGTSGRSLGPGGEVHKTSMSPPQSKFAVIILVCHLMRLNSTCDLVKWGPPMWKFLNIILFSKIAGCLYLHKELILETSY
ncbi:uncharacterized protein LOC114260397 isoform X2 [Camellia sinensis]|uniref:uncharacterized protein LOC114260397 isoform X2 n=1 Tax=Camellia sinensis TaxID=4442 RepID=UPI00103604C2|nr:uncharacterized protein LOC114260397 isoform X2 [Camellia sinensis]